MQRGWTEVEILSKIRLLVMKSKQVIVIVYTILKGGGGMDLMFAYLIQLGEMTIEEVMSTFPAYYDKTVKRLEAMGFDENGQLMA